MTEKNYRIESSITCALQLVMSEHLINNEMGRTCNTHEKSRAFIICSSESPRERRALRNPSVDGRTN
jgi:hypothetical protein